MDPIHCPAGYHYIPVFDFRISQVTGELDKCIIFCCDISLGSDSVFSKFTKIDGFLTKLLEMMFLNHSVATYEHWQTKGKTKVTLRIESSAGQVSTTHVRSAASRRRDCEGYCLLLG